MYIFTLVGVDVSILLVIVCLHLFFVSFGTLGLGHLLGQLVLMFIFPSVLVTSTAGNLSSIYKPVISTGCHPLQGATMTLKGILLKGSAQSCCTLYTCIW
jgi:hypothetical protein